MEPLSLWVQTCALVALVAFIFMIGGILRNRPGVFVVALVVVLVAVLLAAILGFPYPMLLPASPLPGL